MSKISMPKKDEFTLKAFLAALAQLEEPLGTETQTAVNHIAHSLQDDGTDAVNQLRELAKQDPLLQTPYKTARTELQRTYQAQERSKFVLPAFSTNLSVAADSEHLQLLGVLYRILSATESVGSVHRLNKAYEHALSIFRTPETAWDWLNSPNGALAGVIPMDLMTTDADAHKVHTILGRIEHGVFS